MLAAIVLCNVHNVHMHNQCKCCSGLVGVVVVSCCYGCGCWGCGCGNRKPAVESNYDSAGFAYWEMRIIDNL